MKYSLPLLALIATTASAAPRTLDQARAIAHEALSRHAHAEVSLSEVPLRAAQRPVAETEAEAQTVSEAQAEFTPYYLFTDNEQHSFVVVSGSDLMPAVLGYSTDGNLPESAEQLPESMRSWLQYIADVQDYLEQHPDRAPLLQQAQAAETPIAQLVTTKWNQDTPYNDQCPMVNGQRAVTGCVATSTSQIINYYQYPAQFEGTYSYIDNTTTRTIDFSEHTIDYSLLLDDYSGRRGTDEERAEVAELMMCVGHAVNMSYGETSGALTDMCVRGLRTNLGHTKAQALRRKHYTLDEWNEVIRYELNNNRPIIFGGHSSTGGHSFVVDGMDAAGFYHVNWGWGGMGNGHFDVSVMHPEVTGIGASDSADGFNQGQEIIVNLGNPENLDRVYSQLAVPDAYYIKCNKTTATLGQSITLSASTYNTEPFSFTGFAGVIIMKDGEIYHMEENSTQFTVGATKLKSVSGGGYVYSSYGSRDISRSITLPADMPEGTYRIYLYVRPEGSEQIAYVRQLQTRDNYWTCEVSGQKAYLSHPMATLPVEPISWNFQSEELSTRPSQVRVTLSNQSDASLACVLYARFTRPDGTVLSDVLADRVLSISPEQQEEVSFDVTFTLDGEWKVELLGRPIGIDTENLISLCTERFNVVGDPTMGAQFTVAKKLEVTTDKVWNIGPIDFTIQLTNSGAAYDGKIAVRLYSNKNSVATKYLQAEIENEMTFPKLETQEVNISGELNLTKLSVASTTLYARAFYLYGDDMVQLTSTPTSVQVFKKEDAAIEAVTVDQTDPNDFSNAEVYDICGRRIQANGPLPRGIYIVNGQKRIVR